MRAFATPVSLPVASKQSDRDIIKSEQSVEQWSGGHERSLFHCHRLSEGRTRGLSPYKMAFYRFVKITHLPLDLR